MAPGNAAVRLAAQEQHEQQRADYRTDDSTCGAPDPVRKCGFSAVRKVQEQQTMPRVKEDVPKPEMPAVAGPGSLPTTVMVPRTANMPAVRIRPML